MNKLLFLGTDKLATLRSLSKHILLYNYQTFSVVVIAIGLLTVLVSTGFIFFQTPSAQELSTSSAARSLNTDAIDQLELWLENRQNADDNGLTLTGRSYFVRPSITP